MNAIRVLADLTGRSAVICPPHVGVSGTYRGMPEGATCALSGGVVCAADSPAGSITVRRDIEVEDGGRRVVVGEEVVEVYRWEPGPDGAVHCVLEPPREGRARVRVVDESGDPRPGVSVFTDSEYDDATTDAGGWAAVRLFSAGTAFVRALDEEGAVSVAAPVRPDESVVLVLGPPHADANPFDVMSDLRATEIFDAIIDLESVLEHELSEDVVRELGAMLDYRVRSLSVICEARERSACRRWHAREE